KIMAKIVCIVKYDDKTGDVSKTYHIQFDKNDKFEIRAATEDLAFKVENDNAEAQKLIHRWKKQRSQKEAAKRKKAGEQSDEYILDFTKDSPDTAKNVANFPISFAVPTTKVAKFQCGYHESNGANEGNNNHKGVAASPVFTPYPKGVGQSVP